MAPAERTEPSEESDPPPALLAPAQTPPTESSSAAFAPQTMTVVGVGFLRPLNRISRRDDTLGRVAGWVADSFVVRCLVRRLVRLLVGRHASPNQRATRLVPNSALSATRSREGPSSAPTGRSPARNMTSTFATSSWPSSR